MTSAFAVSSPSPATIGLSLAAVGREQPAVFDEHMGAWVVLRHKDVSAGLRDHRRFSTAFYLADPMVGSMMIGHDGSEHTRQRRIHNRFFSPGASAGYAARVTPVAERTFERLRG